MFYSSHEIISSNQCLSGGFAAFNHSCFIVFSFVLKRNCTDSVCRYAALILQQFHHLHFCWLKLLCKYQISIGLLKGSADINILERGNKQECLSALCSASFVDVYLAYLKSYGHLKIVKCIGMY